jgi:hypothetical protein
MDEAFAHGRVKFSGTSFAVQLSYHKQADRYILNSLLQGGPATTVRHRNGPAPKLLWFQVAAAYASQVTDYRLLGSEISSTWAGRSAP